MSIQNPSLATIRRLPTSVINRIAAGEVVQRPSGAIKELIENSIDAYSTDVNVSIEDGGLSLIKVLDNGQGIDPDDFELLCERFATSKLSEYNDLNTISTFGFRGEALSSLTYVGKVTVTSMLNPTAFLQSIHRKTCIDAHVLYNGVEWSFTHSNGIAMMPRHPSDSSSSTTPELIEVFNSPYHVITQYLTCVSIYVLLQHLQASVVGSSPQETSVATILKTIVDRVQLDSANGDDQSHWLLNSTFALASKGSLLEYSVHWALFASTYRNITQGLLRQQPPHVCSTILQVLDYDVLFSSFIPQLWSYLLSLGSALTNSLDYISIQQIPHRMGSTGSPSPTSSTEQSPMSPSLPTRPTTAALFVPLKPTPAGSNSNHPTTSNHVETAFSADYIDSQMLAPRQSSTQTPSKSPNAPQVISKPFAVAGVPGTVITVTNLFESTPLRLRALGYSTDLYDSTMTKSQKTMSTTAATKREETNRCVGLLSAYSIHNPSLSMQLRAAGTGAGTGTGSRGLRNNLLLRSTPHQMAEFLQISPLQSQHSICTCFLPPHIGLTPHTHVPAWPCPCLFPTLPSPSKLPPLFSTFNAIKACIGSHFLPNLVPIGVWTLSSILERYWSSYDTTAFQSHEVATQQYDQLLSAVIDQQPDDTDQQERHSIYMDLLNAVHTHDPTLDAFEQRSNIKPHQRLSALSQDILQNPSSALVAGPPPVSQVPFTMHPHPSSIGGASSQPKDDNHPQNHPQPSLHDALYSTPFEFYEDNTLAYSCSGAICNYRNRVHKHYHHIVLHLLTAWVHMQNACASFQDASGLHEGDSSLHSAFNHVDVNDANESSQHPPTAGTVPAIFLKDIGVAPSFAKGVLSQLIPSSLYQYVHHVYRLPCPQIIPPHPIRCTMKGYMTHPGKKPMSLPTSTFNLFVNNRQIQHRGFKQVLERTITDVYKTPFWGYLSVAVPGTEIDVNVHPNKLQVHFLHEETLIEILTTMLTNIMSGKGGSSFLANNLITQPSIIQFSAQTPTKSHLHQSDDASMEDTENTSMNSSSDPRQPSASSGRGLTTHSTQTPSIHTQMITPVKQTQQTDLATPSRGTTNGKNSSQKKPSSIAPWLKVRTDAHQRPITAYLTNTTSQASTHSDTQGDRGEVPNHKRPRSSLDKPFQQQQPHGLTPIDPSKLAHPDIPYQDLDDDIQRRQLEEVELGYRFGDGSKLDDYPFPLSYDDEENGPHMGSASPHPLQQQGADTPLLAQEALQPPPFPSPKPYVLVRLDSVNQLKAQFIHQTDCEQAVIPLAVHTESVEMSGNESAGGSPLSTLEMSDRLQIAQITAESLSSSEIPCAWPNCFGKSALLFSHAVYVGMINQHDAQHSAVLRRKASELLSNGPSQQIMESHQELTGNTTAEGGPIHVLMQSGRALYLIDFKMISFYFTYRLCLQYFANFATIRFAEPVNVKAVLTTLVRTLTYLRQSRDQLGGGTTTEEQQPMHLMDVPVDTAHIDRMCLLLLDKAPIYQEFFSCEIRVIPHLNIAGTSSQQSGQGDDSDQHSIQPPSPQPDAPSSPSRVDPSTVYLVSLPQIIPHYVPSLSKLPLFLYMLATKVNYNDEQQCIDALSIAFAHLYRLEFSGYLFKDTPPQTMSDQAGRSLPPVSSQFHHVETLITQMWLPMLKSHRFIPPSVLINNGSIIPLARLDDLYKVFERC